MSVDTLLNTTPDYTVSHTFSTNDVTGTFGGLTQGDVTAADTPIIDFTAVPKVTQEGVDLFPINSEFGFVVTDFDGAVQKDFYANPEYAEGWAGDLLGTAGEQLGLVVSDAPTDTFKTPAVLGTWLAGIGGTTVKASTEHYTVMQNVLSDQKYPGDPDALYPLDDNLIVIGGTYDGQAVADVIPIVGDVNGDGIADIKDVLLPNESTITENIAASTDYSVTLKDDGKLLYRWGNTVKRPNDIRLEVEMALPDEWSQPATSAPDLIPLYRVTMAELLVNHTVTNNPNDQIRPEDYENESAIGKLPTYEILPDGRWVSTDDYYAGDGTFYPAGTVLKDPAIAQAVKGTLLDQIGALPGDLQEGFTNAWYTTMDREPFEADLNDAGTDYDIGPRWRLQPDKFGQDLPSVVIPVDPSLPPPPTKDEVKYEVGEDTQTVINLLDWKNPVSPLSISAGWQNNAGTVSENGLNLTENFDVAFYIKGDIKPATLYSTDLVMDYEEITIYGNGGFIAGAAGSDYLVGQGGNTFVGDANTTESGEDLFVLSYGVTNDWTAIQNSTILDFEVGTDTLGLIDLSVSDRNFDQVVTQTVTAGDLNISLNGFALATLTGVDQELGLSDFLLLNRGTDALIEGTSADDYLVGDDFANTIFGFAGDDTLVGLGGDDSLVGGTGADSLLGGDGTDAAGYFQSHTSVLAYLGNSASNTGEAAGDTYDSIENLIGSIYADRLEGDSGDNLLSGFVGSDTLIGLAGDDHLYGSLGNDFLAGGEGTDTLFGGAGNDVLAGGGDGDKLSGSAGNDTFLYLTAAQSQAGAGNVDTIVDFTIGEDIIDVSAIDADSVAAGDQAFSFIASTAFSGVAGELRFEGTLLQGDIDGDASADFEVQIANMAALTASDFVL